MILVDDTHAVMLQEDYDGLFKYGASVPTGQTIGKRWLTGKDYCMMGEYEKDPNSDTHIIIRYRVILMIFGGGEGC